MATSGSIDSGGYQGRVLRFNWGTASTSGNTRTISYSITAVGGSSSTYYHHNDYVNINGTRVYTGSSSHAVTTGTVLASGTMNINQNSTTTLTVEMHGGIYSYSDNINTTKSWTLDTLIQAPTIKDLTLVGKSDTSLTFNFSCSKCDNWYYKLSTASGYTTGGTTGVTSGSFTISGLTPNTTYTINFIARNWAGSTPMDSYANPIQTTYKIPTQSLTSRTETTATISWTNVTNADYLWYSKDNGSTWTAIGSISSPSGTYTISGLSANTTYKIKTRIRWKTEQTLSVTETVSVTTYQYPYVSAISTSSLVVGNSQTLTLYNPLNRSVTIYMKKTNTNGATLYSGTTNGTSITFTPTASTIYASIPSATSATAVYYCDYSGHTVSTKSGTYKIKGTEIPTFSNWTYQDTNSTTTALTGNNQILVKGYSRVKGTISTANKATANNSASMSSYKLSIGSTNATNNYSSSADVLLPKSSASPNYIVPTTGTMIMYATDSRGLSKSVTKTATFKDYTDLVIQSVTATRGSNGVGQDVTLAFSGTYWNKSFGSVTNTITAVSYKYKQSTASSWTTGATTLSATLSSGKFSGSFSIQGNLGADGFSVEKSYNIRLTVTDKLVTKTYNITIGAGTPAIAIYKDRVAIGQKYDTSNNSSLQVKGTTTLKDRLFLSQYGLQTSSEAGYTTNQSGNLIHRRSNTGDTLEICNSEETIKVKVNFETGEVTAPKFSGPLTGNVTGNVSGSSGSCTGNSANATKVYVSLTNYTSSTLRYIPFCAGTSSTNRNLSNNDGLGYRSLEGTTSGDGYGCIELGNSIASGKEGNKRGICKIFSQSTGYSQILFEGSTTNRSIYLPDKSGTLPCGTVLYTNTSGSNGTITLSESAAVYDYLEIFYEYGSGGLYFSRKVSAPNGKNVILDGMVFSANTTSVNFSSRYSISTKSITLTTDYSGRFVKSYSDASISGNTSTSYTRIYKVVGYKML